MTDAPIVEMKAEDQRTWAVLVHLGGILFGIIPALVGYLVLKDRGAFVRAHTATALNFQISALIYLIASVIISIPLMLVLIGFLTIWLLPSLIALLVIIFCIVAAVKAGNGELYLYPLTISFVR